MRVLLALVWLLVASVNVRTRHKRHEDVHGARNVHKELWWLSDFVLVVRRRLSVRVLRLAEHRRRADTAADHETGAIFLLRRRDWRGRLGH